MKWHEIKPLHEIQDSDNEIWRLRTGNDFYADYELLKKNYDNISTNYDIDTSSVVVKRNIVSLNDMVIKIRTMITFCNNCNTGNHTNTTIDELIKTLRSRMYSCKEMIKDLNKF